MKTLLIHKGILMKKLFNLKTLLIPLLFLPSIASAELVIINGNSWDYAIEGKIQDDSSVLSEVDLKTDLNLKDDKESFFVAYIEHPIPILPNIRLGSTSLTLKGSGDASKSFTYNGTTYTGTADVTTNLNLDHTEIALYWRVLDNVVGFDLGLNAKFFDGGIEITSSEGNVSDTFDETIPMLYAGLQFELPYGLRLTGDMSYISYDGSSFTDTLVKLSYTSDFALGVDVGYRSFVIDYEDTTANEYVDIDISGPFVGLHLAF